MDYIAIIHKDPNSCYGVAFPGCISAGVTLDEAKSMAAEALALAIEEMREDGEPPRQPSPLDKVMRNPDFRDGVAFLVNADVPERKVRVNITMTARDLRDRR